MTERTTVRHPAPTTVTVLLLTLLLPAAHSFLPSTTAPYRPTPTTTTRRKPPNPLSALEDPEAECVRLSTTAPTPDPANDDDDTLDFDWSAAGDDVFRTDGRPVVLFDGVCKFCNGSVNFALDNDSVGRFRFASLQSRIGRALLLRSGKTTTDMSSIVVVTEGDSLFKSDAVLYIAARLDGNAYLPFVGRWSRFVPAGLRNVVYDFVSRNRLRFGESDSCRVDLMDMQDRFVPDP